MKWVWVGLGVVGGVIALMAIVGLLLPQDHVASRSARYRQPPDAVWGTITDTPASVAWRGDLRSVERLADRDGHAVWKEIDRHGDSMTLETLEEAPPHRLVRRIVDTGLPFGGTWTFEIVPQEGGALVTITERGFVRNPIFRFLARFVFGYTSTLDAYLKALGKKFGEDVSPG